MKYHPDRQGGNAEKFSEVAIAYAHIERKFHCADPFEDIFKDVAKRSKQ